VCVVVGRSSQTTSASTANRKIGKKAFSVISVAV
jgi:hypothetical protein